MEDFEIGLEISVAQQVAQTDERTRCAQILRDAITKFGDLEYMRDAIDGFRDALEKIESGA
jgi:deferrochelatase/peroxidase EfeB